MTARAPRPLPLPRLAVLLLACLVGAAPADADEGEGEAPATPARFEAAWTFDGEGELPGVGAATGEAAARMPAPKRLEDRLYLLESWWRSSASIGLPAPTDRLCREVRIAFDLVMNTGTEGMGFVWAPVEAHGMEGAAPALDAWEAPSLAGAIGVGFDASNPVSRDPFRPPGNAYDRPQHEISLHVDGMEVHKRTTPMEFRDEEPHAVEIVLEAVVGGVLVDVSMDGVALYEDHLLPSARPYVGRPCFGARNGDRAGDVLLDEVHAVCTEPIEPPPEPTVVVALDRVLNDKDHPANEAEVAFPEDTDGFGRIVCTLRLDKPETRFDPWDRLAHVTIEDDDGHPIELLRYITPYHRGHVWRVDVTPFRPLLSGPRKLVQRCGTQGEGWVVTIRFDFHPGPVGRLAYRVVPLWEGKVVLGDPERPTGDFYETRRIEVDEACVAAEVHAVVTGHGMAPNSGNAAEFMPIDRTLDVDGTTHTNTLWKTDNYLNPCRPQGGTWKYDRAGWAPGDVVRPWVVDATPGLDDGTLEIGYALAPYVNENRGRTWDPFHHNAIHLILYRHP